MWKWNADEHSDIFVGSNMSYYKYKYVIHMCNKLFYKYVKNILVNKLQRKRKMQI